MYDLPVVLRISVLPVEDKFVPPSDASRTLRGRFHGDMATTF